MTAIPLVALCRMGPKFDPRRQGQVVQAVAANQGVVVGVIHPLACANGKGKPITDDPWLNSKISPSAYPAYLIKLTNYLRTTVSPILIFLEADKREEVGNWLVREAIDSPAPSLPIIVLETNRNDPLPRFGRDELGADVRYHGLDRSKHWNYFSNILGGLGVNKLLLAGEKYFLHGRKGSGCVMKAYDELRKTGLAVEILADLTFPSLMIEINAAGGR
jgi:hypothetical protein